MNFLKLCLIFINPLTVSILLFVPLSNNSFGNEESVIPESNIGSGDSSGGENFGESIIPESDTTGGDASGGGNLDEDGESIIPESDITQGILIAEDGTVTATPEIIARLDGIALSIIDDLNSGAIRIVDSEGEVVTVHIDTQQVIANVLEQDSNAGGLETAIEDVSFDNDSSPVTVTPIEIVESVFGTLGEDTIFVSDNEFDVTITYIDADNSLNLKSSKIASSKNELQTYNVKVLNRASKEIATYTLRGSKDQVNSAASTITALTLAKADRKTIRVAKEIALDSGIKPDLLVELMLNYEGLFDRNSSTNANVSTSPLILASNKKPSNSTLAQQKKSVVNITKFSYSIQAYNQAIAKSEPEIYQKLTENSEFQIIGETLQRLRKSL